MRLMLSILAGCLLVAATQTPAQAQADFYKGKTVTVVVGARAVGSLSLSAQVLARHWGRHIPGNPTVVLRQMPGGAHLNATNYVFNVAEPDGLTILAANPQVAMAQLFKVPAVRFDVRAVRLDRLVGRRLGAARDPSELAVQDFRRSAECEGGTGLRLHRAGLELLRRPVPAQGIRRREVQDGVGLCRQQRPQARARAPRGRRLDRARRHHSAPGRARHRASDGALGPHADPRASNICRSMRTSRPATSAARS